MRLVELADRLERPGNAPAGASDDLIELVDLAVAQLPATATGEQPVLDSGVGR
jgi:hypothetical protein